MTEPLIEPESPDPLLEDSRAFWREMGKNMIRESLGTIDETAKQIIGMAGILEGLYFHAITFSDLRGQVTSGWPLIAYLSPMRLTLSVPSEFREAWAEVMKAIDYYASGKESEKWVKQ